MNIRLLSAGVLVYAALGGAVPAAAQETDDPFETARFRFGPVRFTPALELTSLGRDTNVFNEADDPKSDTTAAFGPSVRLWMRPGGSRLSARVGGQYLFFKEYDNQRAWNTMTEGRWEFPLSRLTPFVAGSYTNSRERQGYEIDARARRRDDAVEAGMKFRLSGRTALVASARRGHVEYDANQVFLGTELGAALNRTEEAARLQFRYALTPLTTFVVDSEVASDRFATAPVRDTDSVRVMPGFELNPLALISGRVSVGYRQFEPLSAALPAYRGVVAAVNATYVRSATRFEARVNRDLAYSFEPERPYYALLDLGLTVTQRVTRRWELVGRGGRQTLAYREVAAADRAGAPAPDRGYTLGAGLGHWLGETLRLGADVNYYTRRSEIAGRREYEGLRVFGSISYGIQ